jgi:undecaprenyl-diphosphatase
MPMRQWIATFDSMAGDPVRALRTPTLTSFFYLCTLLANTGTVVFITTVTIIALAWRRRFADALLVFVVVAGGQLLGTLAKNLVVRQRPPASAALISLPGTYAFPSGHALAAVLLYGVLAFLTVRALHSSGARIAVAGCAIALIALVGVSRVYLGVHWPSDVVAAWLLGSAWLAVCCAVYLSQVRWRGSALSGTSAPTGGR